MVKKIWVTIIVLFFVTAFLSGNVFAEINPPDFPSCLNPQGTEIANHVSGTHGVVGVVTTYQGADTVYSISEDVIVQCLCTDPGEGIQTNWWKISELSSEEIENFKTQGWIFVPDGSAWGLAPESYLAMNANYSCRPIGGNTSNSNNESKSVGGISSIGEILGLATTGNIKVIYGLIFTGFLSFTVGHLIKSKFKNV